MTNNIDDEIKVLEEEITELESGTNKEQKLKDLKKKRWKLKHGNDFDQKVLRMSKGIGDFALKGVGNIFKGFFNWLDKMSDPPDKRTK